jgi:hypothetical protein
MPVFRPSSLRSMKKPIERHWRQPGWYRWWAPAEVCRELLTEFADQIIPELTEGNDELLGHYLVYVGMTKETLYSRVIKWHICESHNFGKVHHRTLSTFRQTVSSLTVGNWADELTTNNAIDKMKVEVFPVDLIVGSPETKSHLKSLEGLQISQHLVPFNIQGNRDSRLANFHKHLSKQRKLGRERGLQELMKEVSGEK